MGETIVELDMREFNKAAKELMERTSRTIPDFINTRMLFAAKKAIQETVKANRREIERIMGIVSNKETLRGGRAGKRGWVRITKRKLMDDLSRSFAARIVAKKFNDTGQWIVKGKDLREKAINLIAAKVRSVGYIRSGWNPAVRKLFSATYGRSSAGFKGGKGWAIPCPKGIVGPFVCTIANSSLGQRPENRTTWHGSKGDPMPVAKAGLARAMESERQEMLKHLAEKLNPVFKSVSAKH